MSASDYEIVVGLEVHAQLSTNSKMFCWSGTTFGSAPNSLTDPVCMGLPGSLPVVNKSAVEMGMLAAMGLNCKINKYNKFDRKNYYYPDQPKNYQISQFDLPLCEHGHVDIPLEDGSTKRIGVTRIHLEEDAGKSLHEEHPDYTCIDLNRCGTPLIEIVSEPDMANGKEAFEYLTRLKLTLLYLGVSDCEMQEGSLRCDANISVRKPGEPLGTKTEVKNMNSFRGVEMAIGQEAKRQIEILESGGTIPQETRLWDTVKEVTRPMRTKEDAHDYRYFPDPDLPPLMISDEWMASVREQMPELPYAKRERFIKDFGIPEYDADVLIQEKANTVYFESLVNAIDAKPKEASNWMMGEVSRVLNERKISIDEFPLKADVLAELINLYKKDTISLNVAKQVFDDMLETGKSAQAIVDEKGLAQVSDTSELEAIVDEIIANNPDPVADYQSGNKKAISFFVGQCMKATKGKANPKVINQLLQKKLG